MAPTFHLVRHAQGYHNLCKENEHMPDPSLTPFGEQQSRDLGAEFPYHDRLTTLVASPMRRTIQTCMLAFDQEKKLYPIITIDSLQELSDLPAETGSSKEKIKEEFGDDVNLDRVRDEWTAKKDSNNPFQPTLPKIIARATAARQALREIANMDSDEHIAVVTHGGFLHWLTCDWENIPVPFTTGWKNCEFRSYQFADSTGLDKEALLVETDPSWLRRHDSTSKRATEAEQAEMREALQVRLLARLNPRA